MSRADAFGAFIPGPASPGPASPGPAPHSAPASALV
jgi:hypothetical protein